MKRLMALMALTILTACDYGARKDIRTEREDRLYRAAMDDYRAGRMDAAMKGFEESVRKDPANASARFQLACLQQDLKKDYVSAYCGYREFLLQHPESDRARLARDRMAVCEREAARELAAKHGFNSADAASRELEVVRAEVKTLKNRVAAAEKSLGSSQERVRSLLAERDRLLATVKGVGLSSEDSSGEGVASAGMGGMDALLKEKRLLEEEAEDETSTGSSLIPVRKQEDVVRPVAVAPEKKAEETPARPKTYVVEEGDTLYGIAKRFYGSIQPWKAIRDANKAIISSDNRLKAGDTITLP